MTKRAEAVELIRLPTLRDGEQSQRGDWGHTSKKKDPPAGIRRVRRSETFPSRVLVTSRSIP